MTKIPKSMEEYIKEAVLPFFNKVAQETPKNHMMVSSTDELRKSFTFYQPHNYRAYYRFSKVNFNPDSFINPWGRGMVVTDYEYKKLNYGKEHSFIDYRGCNIRVKKNQIEIVNKIDHKKWYTIELGNTEEVNSQIKRIIATKDKQCTQVLRAFIQQFGGESDYNIINRITENKVKAENSIDLIPLNMKFHNKVVKKVYNKNNVEFSDPAFVAKYLENRAVEDIAPDIALSINKLAENLYTLNPLAKLKQSVKRLNDIFKDQNKQLINLLSKYEKIEFEKWLFEVNII